MALAENRVSLTVAGLPAPVLQDNNVEKLIGDCTGMTKREAEEYLVALRPKPVFTASIRRKPGPPNEQTTTSLKTTSVQEPRATPRVSPSILESARPEVFNFRFAADRKFKEKFERLVEVLGVENPLQHMAEIMEKALDIALDKKDVKRKRARRLEREARGIAGTPQEKSRPGEILAKSRYIPSEVSRSSKRRSMPLGGSRRRTAAPT